MAPSDVDFYKRLGLGRHATDEEIKKSFRRLAKEEHPDKNPNNPKAKERFQELQQAYETLRDQLERSKYDEDNPHHGLERSSYRTPAGVRSSGTAKRYATGTPSHTPGWANGTARDYEGFAQQAAGSSTKPKAWNATYDAYEEWDNTAKTNSGFPYQTGGYRPSTRPSAEYEDSFRPKRESAHAKTFGQREQHNHSGKYGGHNTSSGSPRPKSTTGTNAHSGTNARYTAQPSNLAPGGFNIADYIREKKAKEEAAAEEKKKQEAEEQKARREVEEQLKRQEEERKAKEKDRRRAEAEANRNFYEDPYGARNGYPYAYGTESTPYARKGDEELQREAEERVKERSQSTNPHGYFRKHPRVPSASKSRTTDSRSRWPKEHPLHEYFADPENWKHDKSHDDVEVVEATPTDIDSDKYGAGKGYFGRGPNRFEYAYRDGAGVYTAPFSFNVPPKEKRTASKPFFPTTDPTSTSTSAKVGEDGRQQDGNTAKDSTTPNVFSFQQTSPTPKDEKTKFGRMQDFSFSANHRTFGSFTSNNSPEPQPDKSSHLRPASLPTRPQSQPTQTQFVPPPSAPPDLQQRANSNGGIKKDTIFKRELYEELMKGEPFAFQRSNTSSTTRKKRSAPSLHKKRSNSSQTTRKSPEHSKVDTSEEPPIKPPTLDTFGYEPMDAEPTGTPKTMPPPPPPPPRAAGASTNPSHSSPNSGARKRSAEPKKGSPLDMGGIGAVPPLSRSPADVGLDGFESLKETLPFPSKAAEEPPLSADDDGPSAPNAAKKDSSVFDHIPPGFWTMYPETPSEETFVVPKAPAVPKIPKRVSLDDYNRFYNSLGPYIEAWNKYEAEVQALRAELAGKSMHVSTSQTLDTQDIVKYMDRVKNKDKALDHSFTKHRDRHLLALDMWVKLRESVLKEVAHQEQH